MSQIRDDYIVRVCSCAVYRFLPICLADNSFCSCGGDPWRKSAERHGKQVVQTGYEILAARGTVNHFAVKRVKNIFADL
jgi:hypothetical protein